MALKDMINLGQFEGITQFCQNITNNFDFNIERLVESQQKKEKKKINFPSVQCFYSFSKI